MKTFLWHYLPLLLWCEITLANEVSLEEASDIDSLSATLDFIPSEWQMLQMVNGDLNADGEMDYVWLMQPPSTENTTKPYLAIVLSQANGSKLAEKCELSAANDEGQTSLQLHIMDNQLLLKLDQPPLGFGQHTRMSYRFYWYKDHLRLKHYQYRVMKRASAMFEELEIDFIKRRQTITSGSMSSPRHRKQQMQYQGKINWTPCTMSMPLKVSE